MSLRTRLPEPQKILLILIIFYVVGVFGLSFSQTKDFIEELTPYTLLMNVALIMLFHKPWTALGILCST
jgi:hypothetical protein